MKNINITRAGKDAQYSQNLTAEEQGVVELTDADLEAVNGAYGCYHSCGIINGLICLDVNVNVHANVGLGDCGYFPPCY